MGRLKGEDLIKFCTRCTEFHKVGGTKRQIQFAHANHADGDVTWNIIKRVYNDLLDDTYSGLSRKDWTFRTHSEEERDAMFDDLMECREYYRKNYASEPSNTDPIGLAETDDDDEKKKSGDWLTYIIIGVAAAAIIALLIPWKKK